jgi:hypothetical protein
MSIRASSSKQIASLVADLASESAVTREAAVARLTVIGARAVERLLALTAADANVPARAAAWRALEAIGDARALEPALARLADPHVDAGEGVAAVEFVRLFLRGKQSAAAVDRLTALALAGSAPAPLRVAALRALRTLDAATIAPVLASLANDPDDVLRAEASADAAPSREDDPTETVARAANVSLPDEPAALQRAVGLARASAPLPLLLRIVERVREREGAEPAARRQEWTMARGAAHVALATRGSRIALYDLRESLETATAPLPVEFLAALSLVGDASCLEAIAGAHAKARNAWWREHLADTFRTIVTREKLTKRSTAVKKIEKRWPQALDELWPR